jgi:hypothetical protein
MSDPRWDLEAPEISPDEIAVATSDVRCKIRVHLVSIRATAETKIEKASIAAEPARSRASSEQTSRSSPQREGCW